MLRRIFEWVGGMGRNPWAAGALEEARADFRAGRISEFRFRSTLTNLGYTRYGIDREVEDQLLLMAAP